MAPMLIFQPENTESTPSGDLVPSGTFRFKCLGCNEESATEEACVQVNHYWNAYSGSWVVGDSRIECPECEATSQPLRVHIPLAHFRRVKQVYGE